MGRSSDPEPCPRTGVKVGVAPATATKALRRRDLHPAAPPSPRRRCEAGSLGSGRPGGRCEAGEAGGLGGGAVVPGRSVRRKEVGDRENKTNHYVCS